ncbi:MAG: hypothetical protein ABW252_05395 [Polyangiales bacterium]
MARGRFLLGAVLAVNALLPHAASAHGTPPEITQVMLEAPREALVATSRGILFGDPSARAWSLVCSEAFGVPVGLGYRLARVPSGRLYVASLSGLSVSDDRGCSWRAHPQLGGRDLTYLHQQADKPERLLLTVFGADGGVHASDDAGENFRLLYRAADDEFMNTVLAAPGDPTRMYASLSTTDEVSRLFVLRSRDGGASWQRTEVALHEEPLDVGVLAVNPVNPDVLLLRVRYLSQWNQDTLLYSDDGGVSFVERGTFARVADAAFSADGKTSFVIASDGLLRASVPPEAFTRVEVEDRLTYGQVFGGQVLMGGYRATDGKLGVNMWSARVADPSAGLAHWMSFGEVTTLQMCAAPSRLEAKCAVDWLDWSQEFLPETADDAR